MTQIQTDELVARLGRAVDAVGDLIEGVRDDQWSAPTPCTEWTVRDVANHLVVVNLVFVAQMHDQQPPDQGADHLGDDPVRAYRDTSAELLAVYQEPGVLERSFQGPLGLSTGRQRIQMRTADLLAHGWDIARGTGQPPALPEDVVEHALAFIQPALPERVRPGRFAPEQPVAPDAPVLERLVAFLGRTV